jgi:hypothetical protein
VPAPIGDVQLEEAVISTMMGNGEKAGANIQSLSRDDFTCPVRARLYELLREGRDYCELEAVLRAERWQEASVYYITDLFLTGGLPKKEIANGVAELKRLTLVRNLCEGVDSWRERAPFLSYESAVKELGRVIRVAGGGVR